MVQSPTGTDVSPQATMDGLGWPQRKVEQVTFYKFGLGKSIRFQMVWIFQLGILEHVKELLMAEILREGPGLIGLDDIAAW